MYMYDADASSIIFFIEHSVLPILNGEYNTGNISMRGSFDPPTHITSIVFLPTSAVPWVEPRAAILIMKKVCPELR